LRQLAQIRDLGRPARGQSLPDVAKDNLGCYRIELHVAARGQEREARLDLSGEVLAAPSQEGSEPAVESKFRPVVPDEVQHGADRLPVSEPQPAAQLLKEQGRLRFSRLPGPPQRIAARDVHA
jgi:hypothetical protein